MPEYHSDDPARWTMPTGTLAQTFSRYLATTDHSPLVSGRLYFNGIFLPAGIVVTNITFRMGDTAMAGGTNHWFCLYDKNRAKIAATVDGGTTWDPPTRVLALSSPYTVATSDFFYVGIMCQATTLPSLIGAPVIHSSSTGIAPVLVGSADSGLTNAASAPATAAVLTVLAKPLLAWIT